MAQEEMCIRCRHNRRGHSRNGCEEVNPKNWKPCPCKVKYMDKGMFIMGTPKEEW